MITLKTSMLSFAIILYSLSACSQAQDFKKLSQEEVDKEKIDIGKEFITDFYAVLENGSAYDFTADNATPEVQNTFSANMQQSTFQSIRDQLGDYQNAEYAETWIQTSNPEYTILRYKGKFSKSTPIVEIRVVLDKANKIAGFFVKPWSDMLN